MTIAPSISTTLPIASANGATLTPVSSSPSAGSGGMSFSDVLDTINPLQHIPVISSLYRGMTGTTISPGAQIAGDTLYGAFTGGASIVAGAAIGFASSAADVAVQQNTGSSISQHITDALGITGASLTTSDATTPTTTAASSIDPATAQALNTLAKISNSTYSYAQTEYQRQQMLDTVNHKTVQMAV